MNDPVWEFLEALPGKSAALFDWDHALSGWICIRCFGTTFFS